jgi:hypothetical protein
MRYTFLLVLLLCSSLRAMAATPTAKLISVKKIWDQAPHCAFTDLAFWKGKFVCAFREGRAHVSTDGRIRILSSPDGESWSPSALITLEGFDLRDAGLSVTPDNRLMLIGGAAPRKNDKDHAPTGSFVAFSADGRKWTKPQIVSEPGRWLWRVGWREGKAYGISYSSSRPASGASHTALLVSEDGLHYRDLVAKLFDEGTPTEATLRFADDGTMYCLQRRDGRPSPKSAMFGASRPPYTEWKWHDLGKHVGGPNFIRVPSGHWIAAGRFFHEKKPSTELASLDVEKGTIEPILSLPSGGDTSYPGLVWHDEALWVSYYSSHEAKTSIYLAKVSIGIK